MLINCKIDKGDERIQGLLSIIQKQKVLADTTSTPNNNIKLQKEVKPLERSTSQIFFNNFTSIVWQSIRKEENQVIAKDVACSVGKAAWSVAKDEENRTIAKMISKTAGKAAWTEIKKEKNQKMAVSAAKKTTSWAWDFAYSRGQNPELIPPI